MNKLILLLTICYDFIKHKVKIIYEMMFSLVSVKYLHNNSFFKLFVFYCSYYLYKFLLSFKRYNVMSQLQLIFDNLLNTESDDIIQIEVINKNGRTKTLLTNYNNEKLNYLVLELGNDRMHIDCGEKIITKIELISGFKHYSIYDKILNYQITDKEITLNDYINFDSVLANEVIEFIDIEYLDEDCDTVCKREPVANYLNRRLDQIME